MPFGQQPSYLFRDNDGVYGDEVSRFLVELGLPKSKRPTDAPGKMKSIRGKVWRYATARVVGPRDGP